MKERPILFSGEMVRAILDGRKSQTRRVINSRMYVEERSSEEPDSEVVRVYNQGDPEFGEAVKRYVGCPFGGLGDRLWVRETFARMDGHEPGGREPAVVRYRADDAVLKSARWSSPIHMPRWASRITLEVTGVRVERVQEIRGKDIVAEGAVLRAHDDHFGHNPVSAFDGCVYLDLQSLWRSGWDKINAKRGYSFKSNPWTWVIEFKRVEAAA